MGRAATLVGFHIETVSAPAIVISSWTNQTGGLPLYDGVIRGPGGVAVVQNPQGQGIYIGNVYVNADGPLSDNGGSTAEIASGWTLVNEYSYTDQVATNVNDTQVEAFSLEDGRISQEERLDVEPIEGPPGRSLLTQHGWQSVPSFEDAGVKNVRDMDVGAVGDGVTDDTEALQRAIDNHRRVFLPRGDYVISRPLVLHEDSELFGVPGHRTRLYAPDWDFEGAFLIRTDNAPEGSTYLADVYIELPAGHEHSHLAGLEWRAGRRSWTRNVALDIDWEPGMNVSEPRQLFTVRDGGGGRFYGITSIATRTRSAHPDFRIFRAVDTTEPLTLYGPNFEHAQGDVVMDVIDAVNVRIFETKTENHSFALFQDSTSLLFLGLTGNGSANSFVVFDNVDNALAANLALYPGQKARARGPFVVERTSRGAELFIEGADNCSLFRRGRFDATPFVIDPIESICGDGRCDEDESCSSCEEDCDRCPVRGEISSCLATSTVSIDGDASEWSDVPIEEIPHTHSVLGSAPEGDGDSSARFSVAWNEAALVVLIQVRDDATIRDSEALYLDDSIELYIDANNNGGHTYDGNDYQLTISSDNALAGANSESLLFTHATAITDDGYLVEIEVPWASLDISPSVDVVLGFDVAINDDDDGGDSRESQIVWLGDGTGWTDPSTFGELVLTDTLCSDVPPDGDGDGDSDADGDGDGDADVHIDGDGHRRRR